MAGADAIHWMDALFMPASAAVPGASATPRTKNLR